VLLTWVLVGAFLVMVVAGFVYAWRNRPYRGPGAEEDNEWRDEMALRASKIVNRSQDLGGDVGSDL